MEKNSIRISNYIYTKRRTISFSKYYSHICESDVINENDCHVFVYILLYSTTSATAPQVLGYEAFYPPAGVCTGGFTGQLRPC